MFEIYAYGNVDTLTGVFNAIAAIMGGADYFGLIKAIAITGVLVAAFAGLFTPGKFHGWGWLMGFLLVYYALFLPKSTVVIVDKLGSQPPVAVGNVPIGVAFFGHATSKVGDVMTRFFETAFQVIPATNAQLPGELAYQKNGVMFGNRLIQASRAANVADPQLRTDLIAFVHNCTVYDLQDGTIDPAAFARSTDIWSLMGTPNPARFTTYGNPVQVDTCPNAYTYLAARLPAEVAHARSILAFQLNPTLEPAAALTAIDAQIEQAYYKTKIATAAQGAADLLRQNIMINLVQDSRSLAGQKLNDPAALMIATARANATASVNSAFLTMGKIAEQALPLVRNVIEAVIYAVFPFVFLLFLLAQGRGLAMAIKSFAMSLVWIQLWPPLYAILNYVATLASARNLEAAAKHGHGRPGPGAGNRRQHLQRRGLRPGHRRLHGDLDPHHRHRHHQGRRSGVPGGDWRRRRPVGGVGRSGSDLKGQHHPERGLDGSAATGSHTIVRLHVDDERCLRHHHPGQRPRCRRLPLPGQPEPAGQHLHLHRTAGERPGRKCTRSRDAGAHRARGHAAQPGDRADPSTRHPGQLRTLPAKIGRHQHLRRRLEQHAIPDPQLGRPRCESTPGPERRLDGRQERRGIGFRRGQHSAHPDRRPGKSGRQADRPTDPAERLRLRPQGGRKRAAHGSERADQGLPFLGGLSVGARQPHDIHCRLRLVVT